MVDEFGGTFVDEMIDVLEFDYSFTDDGYFDMDELEWWGTFYKQDTGK